MILNISSLSRILSSWHLFPIEGIDLECGMESRSPYWRRLSRNPASRRASFENGGVLISPLNQIMTLAGLLITQQYVICDILSMALMTNQPVNNRNNPDAQFR